jgi:hypothetical protein
MRAGFQWTAGLYLSGYYYISQQVRFSIWINSAYSYSKLNQELPVVDSERNLVIIFISDMA